MLIGKGPSSLLCPNWSRNGSQKLKNSGVNIINSHVEVLDGNVATVVLEFSIMAAIRSHIISLFSGGIFPDRKWWLSCFCLSHNKEEKPVRQPPLNENAIFTVQTNQDEEPRTELGWFSCLEESSLHEGDSQKTGAMVSEAPLANGFKVLLFDHPTLSNHLRDAALSLNEENEVTARDVEDVVDVASLNISQYSFTGRDESLCISPEPSLSFSPAVNAFESKETLVAVQLSTSNGESDKVFPCMNTCTEGLMELSFATCLIPSNPAFGDQSLFGRKVQSPNATGEFRENEVQIVNEVLSEGTDNSKDGLKFTSELINTSSTDLLSKIFSDVETSGIQSDFTSFEDTFGQLDISSENETVIGKSNEESESCFRFTYGFLCTHHPLSVDERGCSVESTLHGLLSDSCRTEETLAMSTYDDSQEDRESISASCQSHVMHLCDSMEKPSIVSCAELCNGNSEQKTFMRNSDTCCAAARVTLPCNHHFGQQSLQFEDEQAESKTLFLSNFDDFVTEDSAISDKLKNYEMRNKIFTSQSLAPNICVASEESNQVSKTELETTFKEIAADEGNSAEIVNLSTSCTGNAESIVNQLKTCALSLNEEAFMPDGSSECLDGNFTSWNNCQVKELETVEFDSRMSLYSLLQIKLLFRSDPYETLEYIVDGETTSLLGKALDKVLAVRRNKEITSLPVHINCEVTADEIKAETDHRHPFNLSKSDVFQEIIAENFEQLFDNEEWLDDDFGFASAIKDESLLPPYSDRILGQQHYSREDFYPRDFAIEDDFLPPDLLSTIVHLKPETIDPLVDQATIIFWSRRRYGEPWSEVCPPETYFTVEGHAGSLDSCSQRSHETFLFHLVAEILQEIYSDELTEVPEPWHRVYNFRPKFVVAPPTTVDVLKPVIRNCVLQCLRFEMGFAHEMTMKGSGMKRQLGKKDIVDRLLITEMYQEEPSWTDYSRDANVIKNRVANKLFISLIDDTVQALKLIQSNTLTNKCQ